MRDEAIFAVLLVAWAGLLGQYLLLISRPVCPPIPQTDGPHGATRPEVPLIIPQTTPMAQGTEGLHFTGPGKIGTPRDVISYTPRQMRIPVMTTDRYRMNASGEMVPWSEPALSDFTIGGTLDGKFSVRVATDGTVTLGEGVTLDEASKAFWDAVAHSAPCRKEEK